MNVRGGLLLNAFLTVALVLAVGIFANYLSRGSFARIDLTEDQAFTLNPAARALVRGLESPLQVEVFLSEDLPLELSVVAQGIKDKLSEFQAVSAVPFTVSYVDPNAEDGDSDARQRASRLGVQSQQMQVRRKGKLVLRQIWIGISLHYQDAEEVLPFIRDTLTLEYELARAIRSLQTGGRKKKIAFITGHGEPDIPAALEDQRSQLRSIALQLSQNYELVSVDLTQEFEIPEDADVALVFGPQTQPSDRAIFAIDQHLMRGGALGIFPLAAIPDLRSRQVQPNEASLDNLWAAWGLSFSEELVLDRTENGLLPIPVQVRTPLGPAMTTQQVNSPLIPIVRDLNEDHPITEDLDTLVVPFVKALDGSVAKADERLNYTALARTAASSSTGTKITSIDPRTHAEPGPDERAGPFDVLVAIEGVFTSAYKGRPPPPAAAAGGTELTALPDEETLPESAPGTRLVVGGSFEMPLSNPGLLTNIIDWMASDETLLAIRPKVSTPAILAPIEPGKASMLRAANVFGVPLLFGLFGYIRARKRRS